MAKYIHEIMNSELFSVEPDASSQDTLEYLLMLGVNGCPVIDEAGKVLGLVTVRDLLPEAGGQHVRDRISQPAITIARQALLADAARMLVEHHAHQLIVQDEKGRVLGNVSAVDLVAGLIGAAVQHPTSFPHTDPSGAIVWSNPAALEPESSEGVPNAAGVLMLIYSRIGHEDRPVWVEEAGNLRARIDDLMSAPQNDEPRLAYILTREHGYLQFKTAVIDDMARRSKVVRDLRSALHFAC
jgi:CBS domain-containing protein